MMFPFLSDAKITTYFKNGRRRLRVKSTTFTDFISVV